MQILRWLPWMGYQLDVGAYKSGAQGIIRGAGEKLLGFTGLEPYHGVQLKNYAAFMLSEHAQLKVAKAPFPTCGDEELIIKNFVVAINPVDWKIQCLSTNFNLTYPAILGEDVAGEVLEVGTNLKGKYHVGQRVMSHAMGLGNGPAYGGFQLYPLVTAATTCPIPDDLSFSEAAVLPLSISTAAAGLFMNATLGLNYPKIDSKHSRRFTNTLDTPTILLWGGSSSVGSSVIQLAAAAGYVVVTTASPPQYKYCKDLGAADVLDYHNSDVVPNLINLLKGRNVVGAYDAIGSDETVRQCASILHALGGGKIASVGLAPDDLFTNVAVTRISSGEITTKEPDVAQEIWGHYVPSALRSGSLSASPQALIAGNGLAEVQNGLDRQKSGVSARKVEVLL